MGFRQQMRLRRWLVINQADAEKALDWIVANAKNYGVAKATTAYVTEYRKTIKARLVSKASGTVQERESYAYCHPEYTEHLEAIREAIQAETEMNWLMVAARAKLDAWRTQESSRRVNV